MQEYLDYVVQHPSKGCRYPIVVAPILLYSDDTSGNKSKKWNKFDCWCLSLAGLPLCEARKVEHIHFLATSNKLSAIQMAGALVDDLKALERGIHVFDAFTGTDALLIAPVICALCDNARAAELLNHLGSSAKMFCRKCMVLPAHIYN